MTQKSENRRHDEVCLLFFDSVQEQEPRFQNTEKYIAVMVNRKKKSNRRTGCYKKWDTVNCHIIF